MKVRYFVLAALVALLPSLSHADAVDTFTLVGPAGPDNIVYTWTWQLPASAVRNPGWDSFGFDGVDVLTEGPLDPNYPSVGNNPNLGVGTQSSHDIYFYGTQELDLSCNSMCSQFIRPDFTSPIWADSSGTSTFILGNFTSADGMERLSITAVPEGSELAMMGFAALIIFGAIRKNRCNRRRQAAFD